jgi:hypothetical protein
MVRKHEKYKWADRKVHFELIKLHRSMVLNMEKQIMLGSGVFNKMVGQYNALSMPSAQWPPEVLTRFEGEHSGTTIPDTIFMKLEKDK